MDLGTACALDTKLAKLTVRQARKQSQIKHLEDSGRPNSSAPIPRPAPCVRPASRPWLQRREPVDAKHKLLVHHEVTNDGNDSGQAARQATAAKEVLRVDSLIAVADAGFYSEAQLAACEQAIITATPDKHQAITAEGRLSGAQFHCIPGADVYVCPGGEVLRPQGKPAPIHGILRQCYTRSARACQCCPPKGICLPEKTGRRQIYRSEHAPVAEAHRRRMVEEGAERMRQRASLVEHPFGTLKRWFGWDHFLVRGFEKVRGGMSLMVLGYNLTKVINILGLQAFRDYCAQRLPGGWMTTQAVVAA